MGATIEPTVGARISADLLLADLGIAPARLPAADPQAAAVGMFDAANGSVLARLSVYAGGRHDPVGPLGAREYLLNMDRFSGFVYHELIQDLLRSMNS